MRSDHRPANELRDTKPPEAIAGSLRRLGLSHSDEEVRDQSRVLLRRIEKRNRTDG